MVIKTKKEVAKIVVDQ